MQSFFVIVLCLSLVAIISADEKYTDKYDNINVDEVLMNERLFKAYMDCILESGNWKCSAPAAELKKRIPDALSNKCSQCTDKQRMNIRKIVKYLVEKKRSDWDKIVAKYDPEGKFKANYAEEFKKEGLTL